jgi:hypothetical protein
MPLMRLQTLLGWPMLSSPANQGLVAVVLRFISRAIRTFHCADLAEAPISLRALRNKAANSLSHFVSRNSLIAPQDHRCAVAGEEQSVANHLGAKNKRRTLGSAD